MAIKLYTGLPGAGKSLSLVAELASMHKREPGRPVYAYGIDGLRDGLAEPCDPRKWEDLPDGSIVVVDEAQKVWPARRAGDPPPHVAAFSEHRHRGFDFLIATQNPQFLDSYIRGLVETHTHVVRRWGGKTVDRYVWQEGQSNVKSRSVRAAGQRQRWKYPRECFDLYKSSTLHTVKRRLPWQYWAMIAAAVLAIPVGWYAVHRVVGLRHLERDALPQSSAPVDSAGRSQLLGGGEKHRWSSPADYVTDHLPRVANQPWSAPVFDGEPVAAKPDLLCVEHENPRRAGEMLCNCYTEQVTPYRVGSLEECRRYARDGVYNPRRVPLSAERFARSGFRDGEDRQRKPGGRPPTSGPGAADGWQPDWRTRAYVQPERTSAEGGPHAASDWGSGS